MKRSLVLILGLFFLIGCMHAEKPGMSVEELKAQKGTPSSFRISAENEAYSYFDDTKDSAAYHYIFKDGKLVEEGAGKIGMNQTGGFTIVPLK